jgi:hypothetical protein
MRLFTSTGLPIPDVPFGTRRDAPPPLDPRLAAAERHVLQQVAWLIAAGRCRECGTGVACASWSNVRERALFPAPLLRRAANKLVEAGTLRWTRGEVQSYSRGPVDALRRVGKS